MEDVKKWYSSKGIWGSIVAGISLVWMLFESIHGFVDAHPDMERGVGEIITALGQNPAAIVGIIGAFFAWFGRWKADSKISNSPF